MSTDNIYITFANKKYHYDTKICMLDAITCSYSTARSFLSNNKSRIDYAVYNYTPFLSFHMQ